MLKIAFDWSINDSNDKKHYTSRFSLLLVVKLGYVGEDGNLLSYMEKIYTNKIKKMDKLEDVLESEGAEKVLILLDGYDEANASTKKEVNSIMKKDTMSECHVVLTSRFGHVHDDVKSKALLVTVNGFGPRQVTEAVGKFFIKARHLTKDDVISCIEELSELYNGSLWLRESIVLNSDDFQNVQDNIPLLPEEKRLSLEQFKRFIRQVLAESPYKELAQCPLLCVMLCCLASERPNGELPSTCSGLYFAMINRNLYRAVRKKAEAVEEDEEQWDLSVLDRRIRQGHERYLQDFGRLCMNGLKTRSMSFSLLDIKSNIEAAKTTDVKVTQLIEAGVLVQDLTESNTEEKIPRYQVPHRTTAEFLAAYYLSRATDQNLLEQNLLDLFRLKASFNEVVVSLIEMGLKAMCLAGAFRVIKFPSDCFTDIPFMKSYFTQHGAAGTWSEFKDALPNKLQIKTEDYSIIVSSSEPCLTPLELFEMLGKMYTGNRNAHLSLLPKDCLVSLHVGRTRNLPLLPLLHTLVKSGAVINSLEFDFEEFGHCDQMRQDIARSLQELLKAGSSPVQLSVRYPSKDLILAVTEAMQEVPEACRPRSFELFQNPYWGPADISALLEVLAEKWLSHLQHLCIPLKCRDSRTVEPFDDSPQLLSWDSQWGGWVSPILKGLRDPRCSLTSLHLCNHVGIWFNTKDPLLEDLMMLATKLVTLRLEGMKLYFDVNRISKYAVREKCSLKSLHLVGVTLKLKGLLPSTDENKELLGWGNVALNLEELTIDDCVFPDELFSWLNLSVPNLRTLSIGRVVNWARFRSDRDSYAGQLLEALTRSSGESIEELSLLQDFGKRKKQTTLHPIREALQRCPRMKKVKLEYFSCSLAKPIGPGPSAPLSSSDGEALSSDDVYLTLLRIVLSVPMLQTLTSKHLFKYWEEFGTFRAIADEAKKWPGKSFDNECNTLTLHGLSNKNACNAAHVFRERGLEHCLRYVSDKVYELWFPV